MSEHEAVDFEETEPELKPCPFCGKVPKIRYNRDDEQYRVLCGRPERRRTNRTHSTLRVVFVVLPGKQYPLPLGSLTSL